MIRRIRGAALALVLGASAVQAQTPPESGEALTVHPEAQAAIDRIRSPYCPGMMLEVCTSSGGAMLRDSIQAMAEGGLSSDSIVELIIAEYGEEWRAEPPTAGTGLWAWLLPPMVIVVGLGVVGVFLARRRTEDQPRMVADANPEEEQRIREALEKLDREEEPAF